MSKTPGSRLSDDLYALYLAGLVWLLLPFYAGGLAQVLPSDFATIDPAVNVAVVVSTIVVSWFGFRGSPLSVSRASVLHELASSASRRSVLYPRLLRQFVARSAIGAIAGIVLLALSLPDNFTYPSALSISLVVALTNGLSLSQSLVWHLAATAHSNKRAMFTVLGIATPAALLMTKLSGATFFAGSGLAVLVATTIVSLLGALYGLEWAPLDRLWSKSGAIETMRSSMQQVDLHRMILDLRRASDRPRQNGAPLARAWMPTPVWRQLVALQHGLFGQITRLLGASGTIVLLVIYSDPSQGMVSMALALAVAVIGFDLAVPLASTADHLTFIVHYPKGSRPVLIGQAVTAILVTMIMGLALGIGLSRAFASRLSDADVKGLLLIFLVGILSALMQARIGSPDMAKMTTSPMSGSVGPMLWGRALSGPILLLAATIAVSHRYFRPDAADSALAIAPWGQMVAMIAIGLVVVAVNPLEKSL